MIDTCDGEDRQRAATPSVMRPAWVLRRRLLLCLFALGTNMGIRQMAATEEHEEDEGALRRARASHVTRDNLRRAIVRVTPGPRCEGRVAALANDRPAARADVEKHDDNCPSTNDVLGKAQWAIGNINGQRTRIETSILLHDAAFHGLRRWSWPTVGAVTCGGPPSVVERVRDFAGEGGPLAPPCCANRNFVSSVAGR
ncbi:hypothetical protein GCM10009609_24110 [Pseudonocardia aurantiaca]|uniref:Tn3 family transposase n=1 Tax=Pseudonocardia aurantiaca TaxID=75290 RepID=A0ABW4FHB3_9PSEU